MVVTVEEKNRITCAGVANLIFFLAAHGYRLSNNLFSHDSLLEIYQDDSAWQIALGRYAQPVLLLLRGGITSPWLIGCCAVMWLFVALIMLIYLFDIKSVGMIFICAGLLSCNPTLVTANAAFLPWMDFYCMALALSVAGVYFCVKKDRWFKALGIVLLAGSLSIYQAYICVSIALFLIVMITDSYTESEIVRRIYKKRGKNFLTLNFIFIGVSYCIYLFFSAALFWSGWKLMQHFFGIWTANTYNGLATVGDVDPESVSRLIGGAYKSMLSFFWNPSVFITMNFGGISLSFIWTYILRCINCVVPVAIVLMLYVKDFKEKKTFVLRIAKAILLLIFPLGANFVYVLSKGMEHTLMIFAFQTVYIFLIAVLNRRQIIINRMISIATGIILVTVIWNNIVFANQIYLKQSLKEQATASLMTRIEYEVEHTEGYIPGVTPVAISGSFDKSMIVGDLKEFENISTFGTGKTSITYTGTDYAYLKYISNFPINETRVFADDPAVLEMPVYPEKGSIGYVGEILVIKISE